MKADVYNLEGKVVGSVDLPESVFGVEWRPLLVSEALRIEERSRRAPLAHAKGRGEVRGGGIKPWRQKGTGRARHGSIRSPLWKGGGVSHGPVKERDYSLKMNKKEKRLALRSLLSEKLRTKNVYIVDSLGSLSPKTKELAKALSSILNVSAKKKGFSTLIIPSLKSGAMYRAARNIPTVYAMPFSSLDMYETLRHKRIVIDREAVGTIK